MTETRRENLGRNLHFIHTSRMSAQKALSATPGLFGETSTTEFFNKGLRIVAYKARRQIFVSSREY